MQTISPIQLDQDYLEHLTKEVREAVAEMVEHGAQAQEALQNLEFAHTTASLGLAKLELYLWDHRDRQADEAELGSETVRTLCDLEELLYTEEPEGDPELLDLRRRAIAAVLRRLEHVDAGELKSRDLAEALTTARALETCPGEAEAASA